VDITALGFETTSNHFHFFTAGAFGASWLFVIFEILDSEKRGLGMINRL
jgi:hypothetical protein